MSGNNLVSILTWIVGVIVALAVGSGMINKTLTVPGLTAGNFIVTVIAGWVVVVGAIISIILAIFGK